MGVLRKPARRDQEHGNPPTEKQRPAPSTAWIRVGILCVLFLACAALVHGMNHGKAVPIRRPLGDFPHTVGPWRGGPNQALPENVLRILGVDDYVSRSYESPGGSVHFYASYFATTWGGKSYHSPRNCMPGSGWDVVRLEVVPLEMTNPHPHRVQVSRMVMQNGSERSVVLYWYQGRGRIMPTEYSERFYRVLDSLVHQRTDGAFVRIIVPVVDGRLVEAQRTAVSFARRVMPVLNKYLPE